MDGLESTQNATQTDENENVWKQQQQHRNITTFLGGMILLCGWQVENDGYVQLMPIWSTSCQKEWESQPNTSNEYRTNNESLSERRQRVINTNSNTKLIES